MLDDKTREDVATLKEWLESAIGYCDVILSKDDHEMELQWLIHDWNQEELKGFNDAHIHIFRRLNAYYDKTFKED